MHGQYVGTRPSPSNPGVLEYYNLENNQALTEQDLYNFLTTKTGQLVNSFDQINAPAGGVQVAGAGLSVNNGNPAIEMYQDPNQELANAAAQAGLSLNDYLALVSGQNGVSPDERNQISQQLGIPQMYEQLFKPSPSTQELYNQAYTSAGLGDIKAKFNELQNEINKKQQELNERLSTVNENPWKSEATRLGSIGREKEFFEGTINNLTNQAQQLADLYNQALGEVNAVVSRTTADFSSNQQVNAMKLQYLEQQAEQQLSDLKAKKGAEAYNYLPDYLKAKARAQKPDTIGSAESGYYHWNPDTGTFEQVIAPKTPNDSFSMGFDPITGQPYVLNKNTGMLNGAGGGGGTGAVSNLVAQVQANPSLLGSLPEAQQKAVIAQMALQGLQVPNTKALSGDAAKVLSIAQTIVPEINQLKEAFRKNYKGSLTGIVTGTNRELVKLVDNVADKVGRLRSGGAINADEAARFKKQIAGLGDLVFGNADQAIAALDGILTEASQVASGISGQQGGGGGVNPSDPLGLFNKVGNTSASTPYLKTLGPITGLDGSPAWKYGLDVDLKKGDPVKTPVSGVVIAAQPNGGFGNQIKIKADDGREIWLSHLDSGNVKVGQKVTAGQVVGIGGNTGTTIPLGNGDGSHLDITMPKPGGGYYSAREVKSYLDTKFV
jgi:murein DD-endopeptidase MepM/ murein hydrolase activator NlpD